MSEPTVTTDPTAAPTATAEPAPTPSTVDTEQVAADTQTALFEQLGVKDLDSLKNIVDTHNKEVAANQSKLEATSSELDKATGKLTEVAAERDNALAQVAALQQGVASDHLDDALALAKADLAGKVNGAKNIGEALARVLERNPAFKGDQPESGTAVAGQNLNGGQNTVTGNKPAAVVLAEKLNEGRITH